MYLSVVPVDPLPLEMTAAADACKLVAVTVVSAWLTISTEQRTIPPLQRQLTGSWTRPVRSKHPLRQAAAAEGKLLVIFFDRAYVKEANS